MKLEKASLAVRNYVNLVTEATSSVCGENSSDGLIRSRIELRNKKELIILILILIG